jgi:hypothetical protein
MVTLLELGPSLQRLSQGGADALGARQQILARVMEASFEVDRVLSEIAGEQAILDDIRRRGQVQHSHAITLLNVAGGVFGIGNGVGTGLALSNKTATAGIWTATVTSIVGATLSIISGSLTATVRTPVPVPRSLIAPLFGRPTPDGAWPDPVYRYLSTRRARLFERWRLLRHIPPNLDQLVGPIAVGSKVDQPALHERQLMLDDVRATVSEMKTALASLLAWLSQ